MMLVPAPSCDLASHLGLCSLLAPVTHLLSRLPHGQGAHLPASSSAYCTGQAWPLWWLPVGISCRETKGKAPEVSDAFGAVCLGWLLLGAVDVTTTSLEKASLCQRLQLELLWNSLLPLQSITSRRDEVPGAARWAVAPDSDPIPPLGQTCPCLSCCTAKG